MSRQLLQRCSKKHLVIHMDINKTIIQVDQAGGRTMDDVLNSNVAANTFGLVDPTDNKWRPLYCTADAPAVPPDTHSGPIMSYEAYIDSLHCAPPGMQELPKAERDAVWKSVSNLRRQATRKFTFPGEVGESYAPLVDLQRQHLQHSDGYYIIPAFFHMVNTLSELNLRFTLIFRTFGSDLNTVLQEWRSFILGTHACKPSGPVLQELKENYIEPLSGSFFRQADDVYICYGPRVSLSSYLNSGFEETDPAKVLEYLHQVPGCTSAYRTSFADLKDHLVEYFARSKNIGGLVDYYPSWAQAAEHRTGGKVFPISQNDPSYYFVFFDDNIFLGDEHSIVDVREADGAKSVVDAEVERKYCVPVNAFRAIVDKEYFVNELCACLKLQDSEL
ncbi:conserved hypothetical protein [Leishmania major strain Friedlin]|uniref:Uncharacterized protein n=1 Tax=Leishmania major TaxID=5664 RepID=Q4Q407_LEIMA|nr:conserved hypothetical protein [Leishmania major strain Friedlin]CAG9580763.1 hypothetical_protein_-_conserved [Leishmania major strain Friedlin]CAJ06463.1 conserved hypothetical protein [Leishmania major strain Friedlin]|eukprot:XP_001685941.1 conserved hypothetical protein [Leishmania major strain Friedlin]